VRRFIDPEVVVGSSLLTSAAALIELGGTEHNTLAVALAAAGLVTLGAWLKPNK
jgi:hypothetical protein